MSLKTILLDHVGTSVALAAALATIALMAAGLEVYSEKLAAGGASATTVELVLMTAHALLIADAVAIALLGAIAGCQLVAAALSEGH